MSKITEVGDRGQRYEYYVRGPAPLSLGWSTKPRDSAFVNLFLDWPRCTGHQLVVTDRETGEEKVIA